MSQDKSTTHCQDTAIPETGEVYALEYSPDCATLLVENLWITHPKAIAKIALSKTQSPHSSIEEIIEGLIAFNTLILDFD